MSEIQRNVRDGLEVQTIISMLKRIVVDMLALQTPNELKIGPMSKHLTDAFARKEMPEVQELSLSNSKPVAVEVHHQVLNSRASSRSRSTSAADESAKSCSSSHNS